CRTASKRRLGPARGFARWRSSRARSKKRRPWATSKAIRDIDALYALRCWTAGLGPFDPQSALAIFALAFLTGRLVLVDVGALVQDLRRQAQCFAGVGADGQTVVADVALTRALADLAQVAVKAFLAAV